MAGILRFHNAFLRQVARTINRRQISTSKKNRETVTVTTETAQQNEQIEAAKKSWVSYGFDTKSKEGDRNATHSIFFVSVTLCLVGGAFYLAYLPDYRLRDWAQRQAFIELRRRERAGLPLVDRNLIPPESLVLPSDEELGNADIVI